MGAAQKKATEGGGWQTVVRLAGMLRRADRLHVYSTFQNRREMHKSALCHMLSST
jgi:hypothetical protein